MRVVLPVVLLVSIVAAAQPLLAHHSFAATYDATKAVKISGTLTKVEFRNPHIWLFIDVPGDSGVTNWGCEGAAPNQLFRQGWRPDTLKAGEQITIEGFGARSGKAICNMRAVITADGRRVFAGQANDGAPTTPGQRGGAQ